MKKTLLSLFAGAAISVCTLLPNVVSADEIIYESFDYALGADIVGQSGGTGLTGSYTGISAGGAGFANVDATAGFSFSTLEVAGNGLGRTARAGRSTISRDVDATAALTLTSGSDLWFSVLLDPSVDGLPGAVAGQFGNTYATLIFGSDGLTDSSIGTQNGAGTDIATVDGGDAFGVGFYGGPTGFPDTGIQAVGFENGAIIQTDGGANSIVTGDALSFIVGHLEFDIAAGEDVLSLYSVDTAGVATGFANVTLDLDQTSFDTISISDGQTSSFDEIRFGETVEHVTPGFVTTLATVPEPGTVGLLGIVGLGLFSRRRR